MPDIILKNLKIAVYYLLYVFKKAKEKKIDVPNVEWRQPACCMQQDHVNAEVWFQRTTLG